MSDQPTAPSTPAATPEPAAAPKDGKDTAGKLAPKQMTIFDQIFIWTMVLLVGVIFGVGPSFGLVMQGGDQGSTEVQRRQRISEALQEMINPGGYSQPMFATMQIDGPPWVVYRSPESYARDIRLAEMAAGMGLSPSRADADKLVDEFLARKAPDGQRTYAQMIADHRRAKEVSDADLKLWLSEQFAVEALDARSTAAPALPAAVAGAFKPLREERVPTDQVVLSAKVLLPEVKPDDADFPSTYEGMAGVERFMVPAATVVQVVSADFVALLAAQNPTEEQAKAWYENHKDDYKKPTPANGQTPAAGAAIEYQPFEEVKAAIIERLRREAASVAAQAKVEAFVVAAEEQGLEQAGGKPFAQAAITAGLLVQDGVLVTDSLDGKVTLPGFGPLKRSAREIGLAGNRVGVITDQQQTENGQWLVMRIDARKPASRKPIDDPEVREAVAATIAAKRAYPLLLAEAEKLRVEAEKAGPGGLRKLFEDPTVKAKWTAEVTTADMSPIQELEPPTPADTSAALPEARLAASLAVAGNPVALAAASRRGDQGPAEVRLVQATGYTAAAAPSAAEGPEMAAQLRDILVRRLSAAAQAAIGRKL